MSKIVLLKHELLNLEHKFFTPKWMQFSSVHSCTCPDRVWLKKLVSLDSINLMALHLSSQGTKFIQHTHRIATLPSQYNQSCSPHSIMVHLWQERGEVPNQGVTASCICGAFAEEGEGGIWLKQGKLTTCASPSLQLITQTNLKMEHLWLVLSKNCCWYL